VWSERTGWEEKRKKEPEHKDRSGEESNAKAAFQKALIHMWVLWKKTLSAHTRKNREKMKNHLIFKSIIKVVIKRKLLISSSFFHLKSHKNEGRKKQKKNSAAKKKRRRRDNLIASIVI
jgi:hypothetical protein